MLTEDVGKWFDDLRRIANAQNAADPKSYIDAHSSVVRLPDQSRSAGDLIILIAARISADQVYDVYHCSLPAEKHFAASFPISPGLQAGVHSHNYMELAFVIRGTMHIRLGETTKQFETGEICLIRRGLLHADVLECNDAMILYLGVSDRFFSEAFLTDTDRRSSNTFLRDIIVNERMQHDFVRFIPKHQSLMIPQLFLRVLEEMFRLDPGNLHLTEGYCERILYLLPTEYQIMLTDVERREYSYYLYQDVKAYIEEHYASVTTGELSEQFGYQKDYFNRLIRKFSGNIYTQLLQSTRIKAAASLLETTDLSIENISQLVGYSNLGYFYRTFQSVYGCRPREYRKARFNPENEIVPDKGCTSLRLNQTVHKAGTP